MCFFTSRRDCWGRWQYRVSIINYSTSFFTCGRSYWSNRGFCMCFFSITRNCWSFSMSFLTSSWHSWSSFMSFFVSYRSNWCFCMSFFSSRNCRNCWCNRRYRSFSSVTSSMPLSRCSFFFSWSYSRRSSICTRMIRGCIFFFIFRFISHNVIFCFDLV